MTSTVEGLGGHPVAEYLHAANEDATKLVDTPLWSLTDDQVADLVATAGRVESQVAELKLRLVAEVHTRDLAGRAAVPSTQAWLRGVLNVSPAAAKGAVVLAAALQQLEPTRHALANGRISPGHAGVIADAVTELPAGGALTLDTREARDTGAAGGTGEHDPGGSGDGGDALTGDTGERGGLRRRAEADLMEAAERFTPPELARLARRIGELADPEGADAREAAKLAELERRAWRRRELRFTPDGHGAVHVRGRLDVECATVVRRALDPLTKPRPAEDGTPDRRSPGARVVDDRVIHKGHWQFRITNDGWPEFVPPKYIAPQQTPLRNPMHHLKRKRKHPNVSNSKWKSMPVAGMPEMGPARRIRWRPAARLARRDPGCRDAAVASARSTSQG